MQRVSSMLSRVKRLETSREALSPVEIACGSIENFEAEIQAGIEAGRYDPVDMPIVLAAVRSWHEQGYYGRWYRHRVWNFAG